MKYAKSISIVLLFFTLTGCATLYQPLPTLPDHYLHAEKNRVTSALEKEIARLDKKLPTEQVIQQMHGGSITGVAYSPDGSLLATSSRDSLIKIWGAKDGKLLHNLKNKSHNGKKKSRVNAVAFSPDGKYIVSGGSDGLVKIWDVKSGAFLKSFSLPQKQSTVLSVDYSPDGKRIIAAGGFSNVGRAHIWDISSGKMVTALQGHSDKLTGIQYSSNGKLILSGSYDKTLRLWDAQTGKLLITMKTPDKVRCIAFSKGGNLVAGGFNNGLVSVWNLKKRRKILTEKTHSPIYKTIDNIKFSPDGRSLYFSTHTFMSKVNLKNGQVQKFDQEYCDTFDISPDGKQIANASRTAGGIRLWDNNKNKEILTFSQSSKDVRNIAVSPDGKTLLAGGYDQTLHLWDMKNGKLIRSMKQAGNESIYTVAFSSDGRRMVGGGIDFDKKTDVRDVSTGEIVFTLANKTAHSYNSYNSILFSPDGRTIWSGSEEGGLQRWNATTGALERSFTGFKSVKTLAFSPDGRLIAAGLSPFGIKVLNVRNGKEIFSHKNSSRDFRYRTAVPKFLNNEALLIGGATRLKSVNLKTGKISTDKDCKAAAFDLSPDKKFIISNYSGGDLQLWNRVTGTLIRIFKGHHGSVNAVRFAKNGTLAISGGSDGTIRYWNVETGEQICLSMIDKNGEWVVMTPAGEFDKSQGFKGLHWVRGLEVLELDQFFDTFYKPGLMARVLEMGGETKIAAGKTIDALMASPPPTVKIVSPKALGRYQKEDATIAISPKGTVEVVLQATDNGGGIKNITLFHNGKPVNGKQRGIKKSAENSRLVSFVVTLLDGKNTFTAVAKSKTGLESKPVVAAILYKDPELEKPDGYFVIVGINKYKNKRYNLNYGRADAEAVSALFKEKSKKLFRTIHVTELFDARATKNNINRAFEKVVQSARPKDVFILYYAGHGVMVDNKKGEPHFYIAPHDVTSLYREKNVWANGISAEQLTGYSKNIKARKQMLIMDACQAGGFEQTFAMRGAVEEKALKQLSRSSGLYLLAATQSEQFATEFASLKHGVFTYAILQGLRGEADGSPKDGKTTVRELSAFIEDKVPGLTEKHRGSAQYPSIYGRGQDFPILLSQ